MVALDNLDLAILHAGGSGASVCQCKTAVISTTKDVPMQVDGEPCMMKPCTIKISLGDSFSAPSAKMLVRNKNAACKDHNFNELSVQSGILKNNSPETYHFGILQSAMVMSILQRLYQSLIFLFSLCIKSFS